MTDLKDDGGTVLGTINGSSQPLPTSVNTTQAEALINQQVSVPAQIFVRGVIASAQGVPGNVLLPAVARQIAFHLAQAIINNSFKDTVMARGDFKRAFEDGLSKVPLLQPNQMQTMSLKLNG